MSTDLGAIAEQKLQPKTEVAEATEPKSVEALASKEKKRIVFKYYSI